MRASSETLRRAFPAHKRGFWEYDVPGVGKAIAKYSFGDIHLKNTFKFQVVISGSAADS